MRECVWERRERGKGDQGWSCGDGCDLKVLDCVEGVRKGRSEALEEGVKIDVFIDYSSAASP